jgi:DHA1 family multidrug resistance protein-like MFS transporter
MMQTHPHQAPSLSREVQQRGLLALLVTNLFMWGGFFMVVPLLSIHYVDGLGWSAAAIGLVLAIRQVTQQGLTLFGGMLADRFGVKGLICAGIGLRVVSFALMAWADTFPLLLFSATLAAVGGALFDSPLAAAVAALTTPENRSRYYSLQGVVSGLGMSVGPLIGTFLLRYNFTYVALGAALSFTITLLVMLLLLPPVRVAREGQHLTAGLQLALNDRPFMLFNLLLMGYWFMWVQLSISLPLEAKALSGTADAVAWMYLINSGMSVVLQYPVLRLAERFMRPIEMLICGMLLMAIGLGAVAAATNIGGLLICVVVFSLGGLLAMPSQQTVKASLANPVALGSYFGVGSLALAFGGGIGNYTGGWLYETARTTDLLALPWLTFALVGCITVVGLMITLTRLVEPKPEPASQSATAD